MEVRPRIALRGGQSNQPIRVPIDPLIVDPLAESYLTADSARGSGTLTVKDGTGFATDQILGIGAPGIEGSERKNTHASTAVTATTITLGASVTTDHPHSSGTPIRRLLYDRVVFYSDTDPDATTPTTLVTVGIVYDSPETSHNDKTITSGYYFARYENSIDSSFSTLSDPAPVNGYGRLQARNLIDGALGMINKKIDGEVLTNEYAFQELDNFQIETLRELKRWSWMQEFDFNAGTARDGRRSFNVPTNLDDQNTNKSIYGVRVGTGRNLTWIDKRKWEEITQNIASSTLATTALVGATTITLGNSGDFDDSGTILVAQSGSMIGATEYSYDTNTRSTGVLGLDTATLQSLGVLGAEVFQGASRGLPRYWTTFGGKIYHYPNIPADQDQENYSMDYYKSITRIVADHSEIVVPDPTAAQYYLAWKFLLKIHNGEESTASKGMFDNYIVRREVLKKKETIGTTYVIRPRFFRFDRGMRGYDNDSRRERLGGYDNI